jgi:mRNA interferase MazF
MTTSDVVLVPFPFADLTSAKQRPCLVLGEVSAKGFGDLLVLAMMTSHRSKVKITHDVDLLDWKEAGLPKPTLVRLGKVVTLEASMVRKTFGTLTVRDMKRLGIELKKLFAFWL